MRNNKYKIEWTNLDYSRNETTEDLLKISGISKKEEYLCTLSEPQLFQVDDLSKIILFSYMIMIYKHITKI